MDTMTPPEPAERVTRRHRAARWSAVGLAAVVVVYAVVLVGGPLLPRPKVARGGWRLYHCEALGGSIPPEFQGGVRMARGFSMSSLTSVSDGGTIYVAGRVTDPQGADRGVAVWTATERGSDPFPPFRAANDVARSVAANPGGVAVDPSTSAIDAATGCATR